MPSLQSRGSWPGGLDGCRAVEQRLAAQPLGDAAGLVDRGRGGLGVARVQQVLGVVEQATATFARAVAAINDVGLLAEEVDVPSGEMIGNFPQAFSHIGLVNAAWAISQAVERRPPGPDGR